MIKADETWPWVMMVFLSQIRQHGMLMGLVTTSSAAAQEYRKAKYSFRTHMQAMSLVIRKKVIMTKANWETNNKFELEGGGSGSEGYRGGGGGGREGDSKGEKTELAWVSMVGPGINNCSRRIASSFSSASAHLFSSISSSSSC